MKEKLGELEEQPFLLRDDSKWKVKAILEAPLLNENTKGMGIINVFLLQTFILY